MEAKTVAETEALILSLYQPGPPEEKMRTQESLQALQRSPYGWQLSQDLLSSRDDTIKFFGALTIIVKLNTDSSSVTEDDIPVVLGNLIRKLILAIDHGSSPMVIKKICSALVTFFIQFPHAWVSPICHLAASLYEGQYAAPEPVGGAETTKAHLRNIGTMQFSAILWFAMVLVEEAGKTDANSIKYLPVHQCIMGITEDVVSLLDFGLEPKTKQTPAEVKTQDEALKCLHAWVIYCQRMSNTVDELTLGLRSLANRAMACLSTESLYETTASFLSDTLSNYPGFFSNDQYASMFSLLGSAWSNSILERLLQGDFEFETLQFGLLLLAFGEAKMKELMTDPGERSQAFLQRLSALTGARGYPVVEDRIFVPAVEFWSTFVEMLTENSTMEPESTLIPWVSLGMANIMRVAENCWRKIQFPPPEVLSTWDVTDKTGFGDARKDVSDLLQSIYAVSGPHLFADFVNVTLQSISTNAWSELEAAAFCLSSLSECVSDDPAYDDGIERIFASPLFQLLDRNYENIPPRTRQTCLSLVERYHAYFERHSEYLPVALGLLFNAVSDPILSIPSARAICTLCSSCRVFLASEAQRFVEQYALLNSSAPPLDSFAEERVIGGIACVIQAVQDPLSKLEVFERLLQLAQQSLHSSLRMSNPPNHLGTAKGANGHEGGSTLSTAAVELGHQSALRALRNLVSIAKGMQAPSDCPVELDDDARDQVLVRHWLGKVHAAVINDLVEARSYFPHSGEVTEEICHIFRAGFSERDPGPFVFSPFVVSDFLVNFDSSAPRIGAVVRTACSFVSSIPKSISRDAQVSLVRLVSWAIVLLAKLPQPDDDAELSQNGIDLINRLLVRFPAVLLLMCQPELRDLFFGFTLKVLDGNEPLPKAAAADFWATFITLKPDDIGLAVRVNDVMRQLGPLLSQCIINNLGGNASRSELDRLCEPLKRLVSGNPGARMWLENALTSAEFPSERPSLDEKALFLKKVISLRGARQTNQIVRDFWFLCRGLNASYVV